jgi:hypothetical protein
MSEVNSAWSLDKVRQIIAQNAKPDREERTGPQIAFLPEGVHKIRWFFDPNGELYREAMSGRVGRTKFMCPNFAARTDRLGTYPDCAICRHQTEKEEWRGKCRYNCMVYGYLYETKNPGEYWQADNAYVICGNSKLRKALVETLENLVDDGADMLMGMLTPTVKGFISSTNVTRGTQGGVAIQVLTKMVDPIELGDWYVPLNKVTYMPTEFDAEVYEAAVSEYFEGVAAQDEETSSDDNEGDADTTVAEASVEVEDEDEEELSEPVIEVVKANVKAAKKAKAPVATAVAELPDGISLDMLPEECPGWAEYNPGRPVCVMCDYNIDCMTAAEAK